MSDDFVLPQYDGNALCNLVPSVMARLRGEMGAPIALPEATRYVVVMIDGLGLSGLRRYADHAERLAALPRQTLTCSVPSTTACSLTSLGTGLPPGRHGIVGYTFRDPGSSAVMNALTWEQGPEDVDAFRLAPTQFRRFADDGGRSAAVTLGRFDGTALTRLAFDATELFARPEDESDVDGTVALVEAALEDHQVVYCYQRLLDHAGHTSGPGSWQWLQELETVDDLVAGIQALAGDDVCVLVTGDHGMITVPDDHRIMAEDEPALAGFDAIAGEGRFRQLYTPEPERLAKAWQTFLGGRGHVVLRDEAVAAGWFGTEVCADALLRLGDVLVAMRDDWAVMSRRFEKEFSLVGMHGSLTADEMQVPLSVAGGRP